MSVRTAPRRLISARVSLNFPGVSPTVTITYSVPGTKVPEVDSDNTCWLDCLSVLDVKNLLCVGADDSTNIFLIESRKKVENKSRTQTPADDSTYNNLYVYTYLLLILEIQIGYSTAVVRQRGSTALTMTQRPVYSHRICSLREAQVWCQRHQGHHTLTQRNFSVVRS